MNHSENNSLFIQPVSENAYVVPGTSPAASCSVIGRFFMTIIGGRAVPVALVQVRTVICCLELPFTHGGFLDPT